jgi:hypothetical protein
VISFLSIESLPTDCISHPLLKTWSFSTELSPLFLFNFAPFFEICSFSNGVSPLFSILAPLSSFFRTLLLLGRDFTHWNFLGESLGK